MIVHLFVPSWSVVPVCRVEVCMCFILSIRMVRSSL